MEQVSNPSPLSTQPEIGNQDQSLSNPPLQRTSNPLFLVVGSVIVALLLFGFGGFYLGKQSSNTNKLTVEAPSPTSTTFSSPSHVPNPTIVADPQVGSLPSGWSYKNNSECGVKFAIPPKVAPYYQAPDPNRSPSVTEDKGSGRFWDFPRGGVSPNILLRLITGNQEYKQATTMYVTAEEASGYVSSAVVVSCIPNTSNVDNMTMLNSLKAKLQTYNQDTGEKGTQASSYTIKSSSEVSRWGMNVSDLSVSEYYQNPGGQPTTNTVNYTMFTSPKFIYEVRVLGATSDAFVQDTAKQIFQNLSFE
jgi:hypothetical protein